MRGTENPPAGIMLRAEVASDSLYLTHTHTEMEDKRKQALGLRQKAAILASYSYRRSIAYRRGAVRCPIMNGRPILLPVFFPTSRHTQCARITSRWNDLRRYTRRRARNVPR